MENRIKIIAVELSLPLANLAGLDGYSAVRALVRLHDVPLGYVNVSITHGRCDAEALRAAIQDQIGWPLLREHLVRMLLAGQPASGALAELVAAPPRSAPLALPSVTVAVCTRDRTADLALCLTALVRLDAPDLELLVIDNAPSDDATKQLVREHFPQVRYVCEPRPGLDWARNRALAEARGEIVAYTDDDVVVDAGWARALAAVFAEHPEVMAVTGLVAPYELETASQQLFEQYGGFGRGYVRKWYRVNRAAGERTATHHAGAGKFGTGANMAFRRSFLERIGGFDPALDVGTVTNGGGDLEMFFRVLKEGGALVYEPQAIVFHRHRREYAKLHTQIANNGVGFYAYLVRSALAYPDERAALIRTGVWWLWYWSIQRLLRSFVRPSRMPRDLITAELWGSLVGLGRYQRARRNLRRAGLEQAAALPAPVGAALAADPRSQGIAVRRIDLAEPLAPLLDVTSYPDTRVFVFRNGQPLGSVEIPNRYQPITVGWLAEALADGLHLNLLEQRTGQSAAELHRAALDALARHYRLCQRETGVVAEELAQETLAPDVLVSVVVATCDRPDDLRACLDSLVAQRTPRPVEIIVVDNRPASGLTPAVVAEFPGVQLLEEPRQGLSYARNRGIAASSGAIIVTTDDDVIAPPDWIERLVAPFARADVAIVTGNTLPVQMDTAAERLFERYGGLGRGFGRFEVGWDWFSSFRRRAVPTWHLGATANAAFRAAIFADPQIGLLDEALGAGTPTGCSEDTYLFYGALRAGHPIVYEPSAFVWHKHRTSMPALRRQLYNYSKGHVAYHLTTLLRHGDIRALAHLAVHLPLWQLRTLLRRLRDTLRGKSDYPIALTLVEIAGNLAGPGALLRSRWRVWRLGRSAPYTAPQALPMTMEETTPAVEPPLRERSVGEGTA
ncbi:MAG TPA: glycosyltransferase [Roseiflexaceae bacterium]|nr:glycosyltransferase [Roseiflexaceae bacterium]